MARPIWARVLDRWTTLTPEQQTAYVQLAASYTTCAVGEQRRRFPQVITWTLGHNRSERLPTNTRLYDLGYAFYHKLHLAATYPLDPDALNEARAVHREIVEYAETLHAARSSL